MAFLRLAHTGQDVYEQLGPSNSTVLVLVNRSAGLRKRIAELDTQAAAARAELEALECRVTEVLGVPDAPPEQG